MKQEEEMKELNEHTTFKLSIKALGGISALIFTLISMWFMIQSDIEEARKLPIPLPQDVSRVEFDMQDKNIKLSIENTEAAVDDLKDRLIRIENKLDRR